jgi:hypothetical protein
VSGIYVQQFASSTDRRYRFEVLSFVSASFKMKGAEFASNSRCPLASFREARNLFRPKQKLVGLKQTLRPRLRGKRLATLIAFNLSAKRALQTILDVWRQLRSKNLRGDMAAWACTSCCVIGSPEHREAAIPSL